MEMLLVILTLACLIGLFMVYAFLIEVNRVHVRRLTVHAPVPGKTLKIGHLSDLHLYGVKNHSRAEWIKQTIEKTLRREKPDMIFITGDLIDNNSGIPLLSSVLSKVKAPCGVYAVLGNHDHYQYNFLHVFSPLFDFVDKKPTDLPALKSVLKKLGIILLSDSSVKTKAKGFLLRIAGLEYLTFKKKKIPPFPFTENDKSFKILLSHYPDVIKFPGIGWKKFNLVLSGHTHGGQVTLFGYPLVSRSKVGRRNIQGASIHGNGNTMLYVSRGLGVSRYVPFRFFAAPEISFLVLEGEHAKGK